MLLRTAISLLVIIIGHLAFSLYSAAQNQASSGSSEQIRLEMLQDEWERNPANLKVALVLGGLLRREGKTQDAQSVVRNSVSAVEERMETEGDSSELQYMLGMGALFLTQNDVALQRFQIALSLQPDREEIHLGLIRSLLALEKVAEARDALELAAVLFPDSESVKSLLAEVHLKAARYHEAIAILEELRTLKPEDPNLFNELLSAYVKAGEADKAAPLFEQLVEQGAISQLEAIVHLFRIYMGKGDLRSARIELQNASRIDADNVILKDAFREYYSIQAKQAEAGNNYRRAVLFWDRALEQVPDDWQAQYRLALAHATLKNYDEALERYLPLAEMKPADPKFYADFSLTLIELKRFEAANKVIGLGLKIASQDNNHSAEEQLQNARSRLIKAMGLGELPGFQAK